MMLPTRTDYEVSAVGGVIRAHFKPTDSYIDFARLADPDDIAEFGPLSLPPSVRHAKTGDLGPYSAASDEVYKMAWEVAVEFAQRT